jgi:hypothetical protein
MPKGGRYLLSSGKYKEDLIEKGLKCQQDCKCGSSRVCQITKSYIFGNLILPLRTLDLYGMPAKSIAILVANGLPLPTESEFFDQDTTQCISYNWGDVKKLNTIKKHLEIIKEEIVIYNKKNNG